MKNKTTAFHVLLVLTGFLLVGCGEKGPPLPPKEITQQITAPYDLKATYKAQTIFLNWSHRIDPIDGQIKPESFDVFMAQKKQGECEGCPFEFHPAASVPMPDKDFFIQVTPGYKYYFRVQALGKNGLKSDYSKTIQVETGE